MPVVDLLFPVRAGTVPLDHGYWLFSALSKRLPWLHERRDVGVFNLRGRLAERASLFLGAGALRIRCSTDAVPPFLSLVGSQLEVAGQRITLGTPTVRGMEPVSQLSARIVTFKNSEDESTFRNTAHRFMGALTGTSCTVEVGRRRTVTVAGRKVVGFGVKLGGLTSDAALVIQEQGLGGRRHMGCGLFLPSRE
ncbi:CRISPR-associated protein Cas6, subtype MYXAN [Stigmatella aurantiaca]|uniref:CRISPR-associated protein Cas6, subtype MYXAN n=1 Tax=Stigmatella aurantiaca TaxID=41 RepID=A0A1H7L930_STIAU|nr:type I-MYXAN CRISPR-associated protein Cas6/Cmx6 [Stigmatella aurantiaca]SEK95502.1 CRISPR-associated protein Cas6, subtype MYXAN [Stigmatella aurantiaca]